jgi:hypothetical protein
MDASCREFVDALITRSAPLAEIHRETIEYWSPDEPPVTILFAALGEGIVMEFNVAGKEISQELFRLIEDGMNSGNSALVTAVATGLIEAMIAKSQSEGEVWQHIAPQLGPLSRSHADTWLAF